MVPYCLSHRCCVVDLPIHLTESNSYIHLLSSLYCQLLVWKAGRPYVAFMQLDDILSDTEWRYSRLSEHYGNQTAAELISCFKQKQSELCSYVAVSGPLSVRKPLIRHSVKWKSFYSLGEWEHIIFMVTLLTTFQWFEMYESGSRPTSSWHQGRSKVSAGVYHDAKTTSSGPPTNYSEDIYRRL